MPYHHRNIPYSIAFDNFYSKISAAMGPCSWNSLVYHLKAVGLIELWNGSLKTQLQCKQGGNNLQGWARFSRRPYMLWVSIQYMMLFLPLPRFIHQWVEMAPALLTIIPTDLLAVLLTVPTTLCSAGLEALVPKGELILPPGDTTIISLNWKLRLQLVHLGLLIHLNQ